LSRVSCERAWAAGFAPDGIIILKINMNHIHISSAKFGQGDFARAPRVMAVMSKSAGE